MRKVLAFMLILTVVFPAYCFANPQETTSPTQEIIDEINWIVEDGIIEKTEIEDLVLTLEETDIVSPSQITGENCLQAIVLTIVYLWLSIDEGGLDQITSIIFLIINIGRIIALC